MSTLVSTRKALILGGLTLLLWLAGVLWLIHQAVTGTPPYIYWQEAVVRTLVFSVVGSFLATRRPANPIGWLFVAVGLLNALQLLCGDYAYTTLAFGPERLPYGSRAAWLSNLLQETAGFLLFFVLLLFPTGRLLSSRWRIVAWVGLCAASVRIPSDALKPGPLEPSSPFHNPFGVDATIIDQLSAATIWPMLAAVLGALLSLIVRLHRSRGEERQQIKWFVATAVFGISSLVGVTVAYSLLPEGNSLGVLVGFLGNFLWIIVPAGLPIAVGIAILRYRLYEIDLLINRALVYGTLTVLLVGVYEGTIVLLQEAFRALTGQQSGLAIVVSTLVIAALFTPFRKRIQSIIDRRFYRRKYDATKTLESFSTKLRHETDLGLLADDLVGVVRETMQPEHVSLWLRSYPEPEAKSAALRPFGQNE
jgi:hypothetical protein